MGLIICKQHTVAVESKEPKGKPLDCLTSAGILRERGVDRAGTGGVAGFTALRHRCRELRKGGGCLTSARNNACE